MSRYDTPTITVEFVSAGKRDRERDYDTKFHEYLDAGVREYWIFDRFSGTMTTHRTTDAGTETVVLDDNATFQTELLPGFELSVKSILEEARAAAEAEEQRKMEDNQP